MPSRQQLSALAQGTSEAVVLVMVAVSPWAFGSVEPLFEFILYAILALLVLLWGLRVLLQGEFRLKKCPVLVCLGALFVLGIWQVQPLPRPVLQTLSPKAVELYEGLLPSAQEQLPFDEQWERPKLAAGSSLSLYPGATRRALIRLLAVVLLFAVVRNNFASAASLRRLAIVLVVNGCLLALFAIVQFFTSPRTMIYWSYDTRGTVFGPFICRTHFPYYVNVCIGAGIGLLLGRSAPVRAEVDAAEQPGGGQSSLRALLDDPVRLWLSAALALMVGAVFLAMSRSGILALLGSVAVVLLLRPLRTRWSSWFAPAVVSGAAALALVTWLGFNQVEARLATIWKGQALQESRLPIWADSWNLVEEFPLVGTGLGTYAYAEPLHRQRTSALLVWEHAHNEYLETLIEGGIVRLAISLLAIGLVFRYGYRAVRRYAGAPTGGLALGAVFGFTTMVLHNFGDFGFHLPAIAILATVLCAQLVTLGKEAPLTAATAESTLSAAAPADAYVFHVWGIAPVAAAAVAVAMALLLWNEGRRLERAQSCRVMARNLRASTSVEERAQALAWLDAAAEIAPTYASVRVELGQAHLDEFEKTRARLAREQQYAQVAGLVAAAAPSPLASLPQGCAKPDFTAAAWAAATARPHQENARKHLVPGLRAYLEARDLCPLLSRPQLRLALNRPYFAKADPRSAYLDRAKRVVTNDPEYWFVFGVQEWLDGQRVRAAQSWKRSLELSDKHHRDIVVLAGASLSPEKLVKILPDRPEMLLSTALLLYSGPDGAEARRPFLEKALSLLQAEGVVRDGEHFHLLAQVQEHLEQAPEALAAYHQALVREPRKTAWRIEYAQLLHAAGKSPEARQELYLALRHEPANSLARTMLRALDEPKRKDPPEVIVAPAPIPAPAPSPSPTIKS